jgi:hypothetical protein
VLPDSNATETTIKEVKENMQCFSLQKVLVFDKASYRKRRKSRRPLFTSTKEIQKYISIKRINKGSSISQFTKSLPKK